MIRTEQEMRQKIRAGILGKDGGRKLAEVWRKGKGRGGQARGKEKRYDQES